VTRPTAASCASVRVSCGLLLVSYLLILASSAQTLASCIYILMPCVQVFVSRAHMFASSALIFMGCAAMLASCVVIVSTGKLSLARRKSRLAPRATTLARFRGAFASLAAVIPLSAVRPARAEAAFVSYASPPAGSEHWAEACSLRHPACVHASPGTRPPIMLAALSSVDRAWDTLTGALALPPPDPEPDGAWHLYLTDGIDGGVRVDPVSLDPLSHADRAASLALLDRRTPPGCPLDVAAARAVALGSLLRAAPATDPGTALAETQMLARLATPCAAPDDDQVAFQASPESALFDPESPPRDAGASMFFDWLERNFSRQPGALVTGMWALAPTRTPPGAARWAGKPTGFDVLRSSLAGAFGTDSDLDDVFEQFGIARALVRPAAHLAWHVDWPARPRRLASPLPVSPTGASYVMIDHTGAPPGASLRVEASWEDFGRMRWSVIKLDAAGRPIAVLPMTSTRLATTAALTVELIDDVDRFIVVGVNVGSTEHPFDPNQGWWEPHGWLLTLQGG